LQDRVIDLHGNTTLAHRLDCAREYDLEPIRQAFLADETLPVCDLFLAIGSSLTVYPAAGFPALAKENRAGLVIINREPTGLDDLADLVIHAEIGPTLDAAVNPQ
jgi:NAD-dependent deacetylase|tara:strand:- start:140 stop:454 length:315 start_codon:yes stop_codon:yes gene_type:complete